MRPRGPDANSRAVYSTDPAPPPPPAAETGAASRPLPPGQTAKLRIEKAGRGGKAVTVIAGLSGPDDALKDLARDLKAACGAGGTLKRTPGGPEIEVQGDHRPKVAARLRGLGFKVKGA